MLVMGGWGCLVVEPGVLADAKSPIVLVFLALFDFDCGFELMDANFGHE